MLNLTKQQTVYEHRKQWHWMANEIKNRGCKVTKEEYFDAMNISVENRPILNCYCCDYASSIGAILIDCSKCPIDWGGVNVACIDKNKALDEEGLYRQWSNTNDPEKAAELAYKIAELPERR